MKNADKKSKKLNLFKSDTDDKLQSEIDTEAVIEFLKELILQQRECQKNRGKK